VATNGRAEVQRYLHGLFNIGTVAGLSDRELLERFKARRGEAGELAFAVLVERHGPMVFRVCRKLLRDPHDAADAFQATFLLLATKPGSIREPEALGPYLHGVALRVARCARSALARRRWHERKRASLAPSDYQASEPDDLGRVIHEELGRLPARFRDVAILCDLQGKTYVEAAGLLGCPPGTVMSRLSEARKRLRGGLTRRGLAPSSVVLGFGSVLASEAKALSRIALSNTLTEATIQAAGPLAAGLTTTGLVSASVTSLTEGVLRTMFLLKLKSLALFGLAGGLVTAGSLVFTQGPSFAADADADTDPNEKSPEARAEKEPGDRERGPREASEAGVRRRGDREGLARERVRRDDNASEQEPRAAKARDERGPARIVREGRKTVRDDEQHLARVPEGKREGDDRLRSLEQKLDRLINALEARPEAPRLSVSRREGDDRLPGKPDAIQKRVKPTPREAAKARAMDPMGMMPGMMDMGMGPGMGMPGMMPGGPPPRRGADLEVRLRRAEQEIERLNERIRHLESSLPREKPAEKAVEGKVKTKANELLDPDAY